VDALLTAGTQLQSARRPVYTVQETTVVRAGGATLALHPAEGAELVISYFLDYGLESPIARQVHMETITPASFAAEISACRTFILESEAEELRKQGLGSRTTPTDLLVFGRHGPIDNRLRYANEPARHKILDLVGDLSLLGADLCGHITAYRSGHPLNTTLARILNEQLGASCGCRPSLAA
jgi:UDP-3-O-acyl-N-acetylglucosamine deacetylase